MPEKVFTGSNAHSMPCCPELKANGKLSKEHTDNVQQCQHTHILCLSCQDLCRSFYQAPCTPFPVSPEDSVMVLALIECHSNFQYQTCSQPTSDEETQFADQQLNLETLWQSTNAITIVIIVTVTGSSRGVFKRGPCTCPPLEVKKNVSKFNGKNLC